MASWVFSPMTAARVPYPVAASTYQRTREQRGDDWVTGDEGADNLYDRRGSDYVYGNEGNDYINTKDGNRDHVRCGPGRDSFTTDKINVVRDCEVPAMI